jgi:hypothetical protein
MTDSDRPATAGDDGYRPAQSSKSRKRSRSLSADNDEARSQESRRRKEDEAGDDDYKQARSGKFRFKSSKRRRRSPPTDREAASDSRRRKRRREESAGHERHRSHRKTREKYSKPFTDDPSTYDDSYYATTHSSQYMDPDAAFRESLFDALADDEGAAYWEGVYGQPIHNYSNMKTGPEGTLERMSEEEYAEYVRGKMWEKSHAHIIEERAKREKERIRRTKEKEAKEQQEKRKRRVYLSESEDGDIEEKQDFMRQVDESLLRGEERRKERKWREAWQRYLLEWSKFNETLTAKSTDDSINDIAGKNARGIIPWPVDTGRWKHVNHDAVDNFFRTAPPADTDLAGILKVERVRWHPDKMQQQFGASKLDEETTRMVTLVFQVVDRLWNETKAKK